MIRVLLLIPTLDRSGAEKQLTLLATGLPRDRFEVEVVCLTRGGPFQTDLEAAGIPVTVLGKRWKFDPLTWRLLKNLIAEKQPDILHTWLFAANSYGRLVAGKGDRPKIVVSERCVDSWKAGWQLWLDQKLISNTDRLVGNSQAVADFYEGLGVPAEKLSVIHNGIELAEAVTAERKSIARKSLGITDKASVLGFVGRLAPQKRLKDLLWGFELVSSHALDVHFVLAGDGPQRSELESFARQIRVDDRVHFLGHREDTSSLFAAFDVFWLASDFEGQSNSLMEAMAAGCPSVVSDIAPNVDLVTHEETGLVVPVMDRAEFAKAAVRLLKDNELSTRLGLSARRNMEIRFSVSRMIDAYAELYSGLGVSD